VVTDVHGEIEPQATAGAFAERLAAMIERNPLVRDAAVEVGLVDAEWLADPAHRHPRVAPPIDVMRRFLERAVERHPSALGALGVSGLQLLSWDLLWNRRLGGRSKDTPNVATVVFVDLEGFTGFTAERGDDAALELLGRHERTAAVIVRRYGGRIVKRLGDGLMLVFPTASAGLRAAVELVESPPEPLRLRAGVHGGQVIVTSDDLVGFVVNVSARVTGIARGGDVLATADAIAQAGELPDLRIGKFRSRVIRGVNDKIDVARVQRAKAPRPTPVSPAV
jgi:adenylate cyclase